MKKYPLKHVLDVSRNYMIKTTVVIIKVSKILPPYKSFNRSFMGKNAAVAGISFWFSYACPANIYLFKVKNRSIRKRREKMSLMSF